VAATLELQRDLDGFGKIGREFGLSDRTPRLLRRGKSARYSRHVRTLVRALMLAGLISATEAGPLCLQLRPHRTDELLIAGVPFGACRAEVFKEGLNLAVGVIAVPDDE
jgi:hypothetical protein